jgi:hypothetical protein
VTNRQLDDPKYGHRRQHSYCCCCCWSDHLRPMMRQSEDFGEDGEDFGEDA